MDLSFIVMWLGFIFASYSVVGNDVIQTLGTFLTSNENKVKWWILWIYAASILAAVLLVGYFDPFGWYDYKYGIAFGRLDSFEMPSTYNWYYLLPPIVLLTITRYGIPVSTTFMILTLFSLHKIPAEPAEMLGSILDSGSTLGKMVNKSLMGYVVAFISGAVIYLGISRLTEKRFLDNPLTPQWRPFWTVLQWSSTAFLWSQWLTQDLANIYIYLKGGEGLSSGGFIFSLLILVGLLGYIFYSKGGKVQDIVRAKTNTVDIRAATFIDFIYGVILYLFKYDSLGLWGAKIPMSTTWVFIGLLAGREIGLQLNIHKKITSGISRMIFADLGKVFFGLVVSVVLVFIIKLIGG